jgi:uncharacterized protein YaaQ
MPSAAIGSPKTRPAMKLIVAVVRSRDADGLLRAWSVRGVRATTIDSSGGLLRRGNVALLVGVEDGWVGDVVGSIKRHCQSRSTVVNPLLPVAEPAEAFIADPIEVQEGGATLFVLDVERYERIA